jgi:hypothetical protein
LYDFGGATRSEAIFFGFYQDPDTKQRVDDQLCRYEVAVRPQEVSKLRVLLREACRVFAQKCIYLSVAGYVEFVRAKAMKGADTYVTVEGDEISLGGLDAEERRLLRRLRRVAAADPSWTKFGTYWMREVASFYDARGLSRPQSRRSPVYQIAQDVCSRLGIAAGLVRAPEYRAELEALIREKFSTRRAFCEATGLSEAMLSHVLAGRKDLSVAALTNALERVGYRLRIVPMGSPVDRKRARVISGKQAARSA